MNNISTIESISNLLFLSPNPQKVDLIFVFGHSYLSAMDDVKMLYNKGYSSKILITGHSKGKMKDVESERFFKRGIELGIPEKAFILESKATNSKENITFSKSIMEHEIGLSNIRSILFVCKTFHTRRVLMTAQKYLPEHIEFYFYPIIDERNIQRDNWWKNDIAKSRVLEEVSRIGEYAKKGDLSLEN